MSRVRLIILSLFAILATSAVASASASAAECPDTIKGGDYAVCHNGVEYEGKIEGTSTVSKLKATVLGLKITIECPKDKFTGEVGDSGTSKNAVITFEMCKLVGATNCKVAETLTTKKLKDQLSTPPARIEDTFESETANFIEILISGSGCAITNEGKPYPVTGSQTCAVDSSDAEAKTEAATHKLICKTTGSKLKLGGNTATFESSATLNLPGNGNFSFQES